MGLNVKYRLFLSYFNDVLNFREEVLKNPQTTNLMKIRPFGEELFQADKWTDRQTDMSKLIVAFRSLANAPKNLLMLLSDNL
jgi:hypothetical protein